MKVTRALETKVLQGFNQKEGLLFNPRKILLIGTLGSGKTTVAQRLARDTGFPYASIDGCRIRYGDGTVDGEERTWENFLHLIYIDEPRKCAGWSDGVSGPCGQNLTGWCMSVLPFRRNRKNSQNQDLLRSGTKTG